MSMITIPPSGTDDTPDFEQAIAAGQSIQLMVGEYFIDPLPSLSNGMGIVGPASQLTRINRKNGSRSGPLISVKGADNWILRGFTIDGNKANNAGNGISIRASGSADFCIEDVTIRNDASHGVYLSNVNPLGQAQLARLRGVRVMGAGGYGALIDGFKNLDIAECQFSCNGAHGLYFNSTPSYGLMCRDSWATDNAGHGVAVVCVVAGNPVGLTFTTLDVLLRGIFAARNTGYGIIGQFARGSISGCLALMNGSHNNEYPPLSGILASSDKVVITGNLSYSNAGDGIDIGSAVSPVVVANIVDCNGFYGIEAASSSDGIVSANKVGDNYQSDPEHLNAGPSGIFHGVGNTMPGQEFGNPPANMLFATNRVTRGPNQQYGIYIEPGTANAKVVGNHCRDAGNDAAFPDAAADIFVGSASAQADHK
jgi:parallel beta-helix repeat protein